ncbi:uncharacterized protein LOC111395796 isoform X2 [Olea europaea var. sylvestris]|uniref:uncharacterized protein LOC111395796 isoform X2 n=1 Tax=Olea europaea var. sylvestris TaxID=158386 RepID=UPI000C1D7C3C|nr:uncharacterized protein LOC111395796 isoform X2 [Olea europaea var. sylvestris]
MCSFRAVIRRCRRRMASHWVSCSVQGRPSSPATTIPFSCLRATVASRSPTETPRSLFSTPKWTRSHFSRSIPPASSRRPTALQDKTRESDEDDVHDRDYDVAALANNLSQAFRYNATQLLDRKSNRENIQSWK